MNAIEFRNVTLTLGGRAVLAGVSLKIAPRELVGVLGPNGAGKTTLMRAVLGLVPASQGSIHVLGRPAARSNQMVGYMFEALGLEVRNQSFQLAVMNNTEPSASDVAAFENDLKAHRVKLLIYNSQATDPVADRMVKIAKASHVPVVGATETEPAGKSYQGWMLSELDAVNQALPMPKQAP